LDDEAVVEVMAVVDFFNGTNALADGLGIEPDVFPPLEPKPGGERPGAKGRSSRTKAGRRGSRR